MHKELHLSAASVINCRGSSGHQGSVKRSSECQAGNTHFFCKTTLHILVAFVTVVEIVWNMSFWSILALYSPYFR
jgi:hypothetical protein